MTDLPLLDGPRVAPLSGQPPKSLVILLHGYGSNGEDLISLAPYWQPGLPEAAFVSPNAPQRCPGAPGGYQWWALAGPGGGDRVAGADSAAPVLNTFIDAELARHGLTEANLVLVGFSQGTMMALHVGPRRPRQLAGIIGYSGMLVDEASVAASPTRPPVLLVHGDADPMVPVAAFYRAKTALEAAGFPLTTHVSPGLGHSIDAPGLRLGDQFLRQALA
jgi:phospholipase/carboxylesterase